MAIQSVNIQQPTPESRQPDVPQRVSSRDVQGDKQASKTPVSGRQERISESDDNLEEVKSTPQRVKLDEVVAEITELSQRMKTDLNFSVDKDLGRVIIKVTRPSNGPGAGEEVVRQIPSEEMLDLAKRMKEVQEGGEPKGMLISLEG